MSGVPADGAVAPLVLPPPAARPTLHFIGVSTARSSIRAVFPRWAAELGLDAVLEGVDLPVGAPPEHYRAVVDHLRRDPQTRGALVTTHKMDLYEACRDSFDEVDPLARLTGEVSCLSVREGRLLASAKDPITSGLALEALLPDRHFERSGADALVLGAGGAATAISWSLTRPERGPDRPSRVVVTDRSRERLQTLRAVHAARGTDVPVELVHTPSPGDNDAVLAGLAPGALVVNATGLGKDGPGSPLRGDASFPRGAIAWDLNYRGDLVFLDQARAAGHVTVEDGWTYFLHGWTQVVAEVFELDVPAAGPRFDALAGLAADLRPGGR